MRDHWPRALILIIGLITYLLTKHCYGWVCIWLSGVLQLIWHLVGHFSAFTLYCCHNAKFQIDLVNCLSETTRLKLWHRLMVPVRLASVCWCAVSQLCWAVGALFVVHLSPRQQSARASNHIRQRGLKTRRSRRAWLTWADAASASASAAAAAATDVVCTIVAPHSIDSFCAVNNCGKPLNRLVAVHCCRQMALTVVLGSSYNCHSTAIRQVRLPFDCS